MAAVTAIIAGFRIYEGDHQASAGSNQGNEFKGALYIHNGATQVAGGTDTLDCNLATAIQNQRRNGKTVTVITIAHVAIAECARNASGTAFDASFTISSNTVSLTPKTLADGTTNATIAASAIGGDTGNIKPEARAYAVFVSWREA